MEQSVQIGIYQMLSHEMNVRAPKESTITM
jgi:hypothetical protein